SAKTRCGSRPEMNAPEHSTLATKPVATFGTSRARAADSASAPIAADTTRVRIIRLVMAFSGRTCRRGAARQARALAGFENRPGRIFPRLAESKITVILQALANLNPAGLQLLRF